MRDSVAARAQDSRRLLAQEAARIMIGEGVSDYSAARRLAASRLGIAVRRLWPSDAEILEAAREWQRIFRFNHGEGHLNRLRRLACEAMEFLDGFSPRLTGCVATGAAGERAAITLEVFADPVEELLTRLIDARIPYTVRGGVGGREAPVTSEVCFLVDGVPVELRVWPGRYRLQLPRRKESPRLTLKEVRRLLEEAERD